MLIPPFRGNAGAITPSTNKAGVTTKAVGRFYATAPNDLAYHLGRSQLLATVVQLVSIHSQLNQRPEVPPLLRTPRRWPPTSRVDELSSPCSPIVCS